MKKILCLDFDGVCHSYSSGWKGAEVILDPPVEGMWEALEAYIALFDVQIYSSRSSQPGGIDAMIDWFLSHATSLANQRTFKQLSFPTTKPAAFVSIDDRVVCFDGSWPSVESLASFKPWNKKV